MTTLVPVPAPADFSGITFTQSETGQVHSPWWTYQWMDYNQGSPYVAGSHFHGIRARAIAAFAHTLGITENEVMVSVMEDAATGECMWSCGTQQPCELPKPKLTQVDRMLEIQKLIGETEGKNGVIEI